ncbi:hypothetical protein TNMX_00035 [Thermus sp. NMX2.A1]|nr:hypothetical protein TNMX_00035 [Thermus sp. NMX2.A1]
MAVALYAAGVSQRKAAEAMSLLLGHRYSHETLVSPKGYLGRLDGRGLGGGGSLP